MAQNADINLYKAKTDLSADLVLVAERLRIVSLVVLILVLGLGLLVGVFYFFISSQKQQLEAQKERETKRIIAQAKKEALVIEVKDRATTITKIIQSQRPWMKILDAVGGIANPAILLGVTADEMAVLRLQVKASSVGEAVGVVQGAIKETLSKRIQKTKLESVNIDKDGMVTLSFTFQQGSSL